MEFEDGEEAPITEIREWLDDSGKQISVDVTDLGKVITTRLYADYSTVVSSMYQVFTRCWRATDTFQRCSY